MRWVQCCGVYFGGAYGCNDSQMTIFCLPAGDRADDDKKRIAWNECFSMLCFTKRIILTIVSFVKFSNHGYIGWTLV